MRPTRELTVEEDARISKFYRACGDCICDVCGKDYYQHKNYEPSRFTNENGSAWLKELCNGDLVKL